jgi:uncharacterized protein (TIGR03067 family)
MRSAGLSVLIVTVGFVVSCGAGDGKKDQELLAGAWKIVSLEERGVKAPDDELKAMAIKIAGDKLTFTEKDKAVELSFKLDPAKKPKAVDFTFLDGPDKGKTELGIYALEGDKLRFCVNGPGKERPTEFVSKKDSEIGLIVLQRSK